MWTKNGGREESKVLQWLKKLHSELNLVYMHQNKGVMNIYIISVTTKKKWNKTATLALILPLNILDKDVILNNTLILISLPPFLTQIFTIDINLV